MEIPKDEILLIENMKTYIMACGILQAVQYENIASVEDAVRKIENAYNVNPSLTEKDQKFKESCRKSALSFLEENEIIKEIKIGKDKVRYEIVEGKEQIYKDLMYKASYRRQNAKNMAHLLRAAEKAKGVGEFMLTCCRVLGVLPATSIKVFGHLIAVASKASSYAEKLDDAKKKVVKRAAEEVAKEVYDNADRADDVKKTGKNVKTLIGKAADKILDQENCAPTDTIQEAHFTKRLNKIVLNEYESALNEHPERRKGLMELAESYSFIRDGRQEDLFSAYEDIDKIIRPDGPRITRDDISKEARDETKFKLGDIDPLLGSISSMPGYLWNEFLHINKSISLLHKISFLKDHKEMLPERAYVWLYERLIRKESIHYEKIIQKKSVKGNKFDKAQVEISHFNAQNEDARARGENFANEYAGLNLYRCGKSKFLVSSMHYFRMNTIDRIWAVSYMIAGMQETIHGIRYMGRSEDANGIFHGKEKLREEAERIFNAYTNGKSIRELPHIAETIEKDLVKEHAAMVNRIAEKRKERGFTELQEITHLNPVFDNPADPGGKDHEEIEYVTPEEFEDLNISKLYESKEKDGFMIAEEGYRGLFLFEEDQGIVASIDEYKNATGMRLTKDTLQRYNEAKPGIKKGYNQEKETLMYNSASRLVGSNIQNKEKSDKYRIEWNAFVQDCAENHYKMERHCTPVGPQLDIIDEETNVRMTIPEHDPKNGYESDVVKRFASEIGRAEYRNLLTSLNIREEEMEKCLICKNNLSDINKKIFEVSDRNGKIDRVINARHALLENTDTKKIIKKETRAKLIGNFSMELNDHGFQEMKEIKETYEEKKEAYHALFDKDPVLAYCRITMPECERENGLLMVKTEDGTPVYFGENAPAPDMENANEIETYLELMHTAKEADGYVREDEVEEREEVERE